MFDNCKFCVTVLLLYKCVGEYLIEQFAKNGEVIPEKYDGPVYDDMNVVIDSNNNVDEQPFSVNDTAFEDEPRLFTFDLEEAPIFRGKRQSGFQPSAPVRSASTGAAIVARVDSTSDIVPYDAHVDPDFPAEAPVARGLKNVPEGWNLDKEIDYEFQRGYRKGSNGANPSYSGQHPQASSHGGGMESDVGGNSGGMMQGPYIDSGASMGGASGYGGGYSGMGSGAGY
uniref:Bindin n=1 Tax=Panagrolaimus sp. ES5 TaxID=591445 RepID=A0AC34FEW2_9BILA